MHIRCSVILFSTTVRVPSLLDPLVRFLNSSLSLWFFLDISNCNKYTERMAGHAVKIGEEKKNRGLKEITKLAVG